MWIFAALERAHRFHGRSAKRWRESEKQCDREREHDDEPQLPPAEIENQAHWILRHVKHRHNQWRRPPGEHQSERRGRDRKQRAFHQHQLDQAPLSRADRDAQRHLSRARRSLGGQQIAHIGTGDQQHQSDEHCQDE